MLCVAPRLSPACRHYFRAQACKALDTALRVMPTCNQAVVLKAQILSRQGKHKEALDL